MRESGTCINLYRRLSGYFQYFPDLYFMKGYHEDVESLG